ncbi:MAG: hypothetical protein JW697_08490 [Kosmotogaceae bacterium]|nr:hypothetical protein [Kosmotogaceae bacterium]
MIYRIIFSLFPLFIMPFFNYTLLFSAIVVFLVSIGVILGRKTERVARIQNLTLTLFYVVILFGYFQDTAGIIYRSEVLLLAVAQGVSGFYGFFHYRRALSVVFSLVYWILIGIALSRIAWMRLGNGGLILGIVLIALVAFQDIRRIYKPLVRSPFEQDGEG